ncbi:MAG TPA: zf-TFIIB domain-containing protein [Polyangiaceae bacterium]
MSTVARAIECPKCGAPLTPEGGIATCTFCGTSVVIEKEPPVALAPTARTDVGATKLACPRCAVGLFETRVGDFVLDGCGVCGGIWIDNECTRALILDAVPKVVALADRAEQHATERADVQPDVPCPVCRSTLRRVREPRSSVDLDICNAHGTWFDAHEIQRVSRAYSYVPDAAPRPLSPTEIPDFRAGCRGEDAVTVGLGVLGVLGSILTVVGASRDS